MTLAIPAGFPVIRQSNLETARCLHRFRETQIRRTPEPPSPYAGRGQDFHRLHKLYVDWLCRSDQEYDFDFAENLCTGVGQEVANLWRGWFPHQLFEPKVINGTEIKLCLDADLQPCPDGQHAISGEFDRLEIRGFEATIPDLKSHWAPFDPEDTIQGQMYPWLLWKTMPHLQKFKFELEFVRWHIKRSVEYTVTDLERIERETILPLIYRLIDAYTADEWPATPCKSCAYCSLECPLIQQGLSGDTFGRFEDPVRAAEELYAIEKRRTRLKEQLKSWAIEHGPIEIGAGMSLGFARRPGQEYSVDKVVELNDQHGFARLRALSVNNAEVKRIGKKYPAYVAELEKSKRDKATTTFAFRKADGKIEEEDEEG